MDTTPQFKFPDTVDGMVDLYVKLRDRIKAADDAHKDKMRPSRDYLEALNGHLLAQLNAIGGDGIKTQFGTVYRTEKKTASLGDPAMFRDYVIANEAWDMADWKANTTSVEDYLKENGQLPPGVNYSTAFVVGVRRA